MAELRFGVKSESLQERCDVCHQKDMFDALINSCRRCEIVLRLQTNGEPANQHSTQKISISTIFFVPIILLMIYLWELLGTGQSLSIQIVLASVLVLFGHFIHSLIEWVVSKIES